MIFIPRFEVVTKKALINVADEFDAIDDILKKLTF